MLVFIKFGAFMSDGKTHKLVGAGTGAVVASFRAKSQQDHNWFAEVVGGALGGYIGGQLPDVLEPAVSSWHRDIAHSCTVGGAILAMGDALGAFAATCRENAEKCRALQMEQQGDTFVFAPADSVSQLLLCVFEFLWRVGAGFAHGLAAGYLSHLALDAVTPRSIPLLKARF
jgi:hypothetical protein